MSTRRVGVFVCECGGNISDYVDVKRVRAAAAAETGVAIAKTSLFACSDAAQQEIINAVRKQRLDAVVIASCSPKLHLETFRAMARRSGLNQYMYTQVNIREQCSWAHRHDVQTATEKTTRLVRAGIARAALGEPLDDIRVETVPSVLVIGAGPAGMRAALALADVGLAVHLVEQAPEVGGRIGAWGKLFPSDRTGADLVARLREQVRRHDNITLYTGAEMTERAGVAGRFEVKVRSAEETFSLKVGAIVAATGFDPYSPGPGEFGRGLPRVLTIPEFKELLASSHGRIRLDGRDVRTIAYVYCVGSRQSGGNRYCSRYCCTAAVHSAIQAHQIDPTLDQFHLYRDMRTYGKSELLFEEAGRMGSVFMRYSEDAPPVVEADGAGLLVRVRDELAAGETVEIPVDLVVLVTGMVPRENAQLLATLKLPVDAGGFFHEIHPKLRPVETVVDGVFIAGAAQGPKTLAESVTSALSAAAKCSALLLKGHVDRAPIVATVDADACVWCGECAQACPYEDTIVKVERDGKEVAEVRAELCKGCGACVPVCASQAIEVEGYTTPQVTAMIDALSREVA
jgi:heterodisulfide reductase subunit A2